VDSFRLKPCGTLPGDPVVNGDGVELGVLEHLMLDVAGGRIAYAVVARGGVLGIGERLYAVPWSRVRRDAASCCFVVDIEPEKLDAAPSFERRQWPVMDAQWSERVHAHFRAAEPPLLREA
jgi:sporulation protein YlmC with PRC-barrel domain